MIVFPCSGCGRALKVKDEAAGGRARCPGCARVVAVPSAGAPLPTHASPLPAAPERSAAGESLNSRPTPAPETRSHSDGGAVAAAPSDTLPHLPPSLDGRDLQDLLAPPQAPDELGRLGGYRVLKVLGKGGMGVVFLAEDVTLRRRVALKAMLPALASAESARLRFLREARAAACVQHDHIVSIFEVNQDRGVPYLAMQLLKGESLEDRLRRQSPVPVPELLQVGRETAEGLAAAHEAGLVHRDVKPANIFLAARGRPGREEEDAAGGSHAGLPELAGGGGPAPGERASRRTQVKILDFGLARAADDTQHLTQTGAVVGTPAYMAPEQAEGEQVDARCDLFSLGCVLYRLATGRSPFQRGSTLATLRAVGLTTPPPPHEVNPEVPAALSDLILRLLAKRPSDRPASARAVVETLTGLQREWADGAGKNSGRAAGKGPGGKHVLPVKGPAAVLLAAALAAAVYVGATRPPSLPEAEPGAAEGAPAVGADALAPRVAVQHDNVAKLLAAGPLDALDPKDLAPATRAAAGGGDPSRAPPELVAVLGKSRRGEMGGGSSLNLSAQVWCLALSPDGRLLASGGVDRRVTVRDLVKGEVLQSLPAGANWVWSVAFSPDGKVLAAGGDSFQAWDTDSWSQAGPRLRFGTEVMSVAFSPDGTLAAAGCMDGQVQVWDRATGKALPSPLRQAGVRAVLFHPRGGRLAFRPTDGRVTFWDLTLGKEAAALPGGRGETNAMAFNAAGSLLASGDGDNGLLKIWDTATGEERLNLPGLPGRFRSVAFSPDEKTLATAAFDGKVCLVDLVSRAVKRVIPVLPPAGQIAQVIFSPDGRHLLTANGDGTVYVLRLTGTPVPAPDPDRTAAEWVFKVGGRVQIASEQGEDAPWLADSLRLPAGPFRLAGIDLNGSKQLTDDGLASLRDLKALRILNLDWTPLHDAGVAHLKGLTSLRRLQIGMTGGLSKASLDSLEGMTDLESLSLAGIRLDADSLGKIAGLKKLKHLALGQTGVPDAGLAHLRPLTELRALWLDSGPRRSAEGLRHLRGLPHLEALYLWNTGLGDADLAPLAEMPGLRTLDVRFTKVGDAGLEHLRGLTRLEQLLLQGTAVSDAGVPALQTLTNLRTLELQKTQISREGLDRLRTALPRCRIDWDGPKTSSEPVGRGR